MQLANASWAVATITHAGKLIDSRVVEHRAEEMFDDEVPPAMYQGMAQLRLQLPVAAYAVLSAHEVVRETASYIGRTLSVFVPGVDVLDWVFVPFGRKDIGCEVFLGRFASQGPLPADSRERIGSFMPVFRTWLECVGAREDVAAAHDALTMLSQHSAEAMAVVDSSMTVVFENRRMQHLREESFLVTPDAAGAIDRGGEPGFAVVDVVRLLAERVLGADGTHECHKPFTLAVRGCDGSRLEAVACLFRRFGLLRQTRYAIVVLRPKGRDIDATARLVAQRYGLSPRQCEIAAFVVRGMGNQAIAEALGISGGTVKKHLSVVFGKLRVKNRAALVAKILLADEV